MIVGITGAVLMGIWLTGFRIGWALMDRWIERKKQKPIKTTYQWIDKRPPRKGGLSLLERDEW